MIVNIFDFLMLNIIIIFNKLLNEVFFFFKMRIKIHKCKTNFIFENCIIEGLRNASREKKIKRNTFKIFWLSLISNQIHSQVNIPAQMMYIKITRSFTTDEQSTFESFQIFKIKSKTFEPICTCFNFTWSLNLFQKLWHIFCFLDEHAI